MCGEKNTGNCIRYFLTLVLFTFRTCCVLRCHVHNVVICLLCIVVVVLCVLLSFVYCCSCLVCIVVICLLCIVVVVLCVLLLVVFCVLL